MEFFDCKVVLAHCGDETIYVNMSWKVALKSEIHIICIPFFSSLKTDVVITSSSWSEDPDHTLRLDRYVFNTEVGLPCHLPFFEAQFVVLPLFWQAHPLSMLELIQK